MTAAKVESWPKTNVRSVSSRTISRSSSLRSRPHSGSEKFHAARLVLPLPKFAAWPIKESALKGTVPDPPASGFPNRRSAARGKQLSIDDGANAALPLLRKLARFPQFKWYFRPVKASRPVPDQSPRCLDLSVSDTPQTLQLISPERHRQPWFKEGRYGDGSKGLRLLHHQRG